MRKWEEENNRRLHYAKIQNAKSSVNTSNLSKNSSSMSSPSFTRTNYNNHNGNDSPQLNSNNDISRTSHSSQLSDYYDAEKQDLTQIPLYKLLRHYSLQQYAKALISRGFGYDLTKIATLGRQDLEQLIIDINMMPGHKVKMMKLKTHITKLCKEIVAQENLISLKQNFFPKETSSDLRKPQSSQSSRVQSANKNTKQLEKKTSEKKFSSKNKVVVNPNIVNKKPPQKKIASNNKKTKGSKKLEKIGFDFFSDSHQSLDDEFSRILENILDQYQEQFNSDATTLKTNLEASKSYSNQAATHNKNTVKTELNNLKHFLKDVNPASTPEASQISESSEDLIDILKIAPRISIDPNIPEKEDNSSEKIKGINTQNLKNQTNKLTVESGKKFTEESKASLDAPGQKARVLELLATKLDTRNLTEDNLNLEVQKIKDLYTSFDGAKMTSTIANLDIEEMSYCLACAIQKHIEFFVDQIYPNKDFSFEGFTKRIAKQAQKVISNPSVNGVKNRLDGAIIDAPQLTEIILSKDNKMQNYNKEAFTSLNNVAEVKEQLYNGEDNVVESEPSQIEERHAVTRQPEQDDEVLHSESVVNTEKEEEYEEEIIEEEEEYPEEDDSYEADNEYFKKQELGTDDLEVVDYKGIGMRLDPHLTSDLDIISEKSWENSHTTVKLSKAMTIQKEDNKSEANLSLNKVQSDNIENFLRESLRDSLLLNLKQESQNEDITEKKSVFSVQAYPIEKNEATTSLEINDLRKNGSQKVEPQAIQNIESVYSVQDKQKNKQLLDSFMEESMHSEFEVDYEDVDAEERIRRVFEEAYYEKNLKPEDFNRKIKDTIDRNFVSNYCKNIVTTTKMEKEVIILSLVYIERLILKTNMYLNALNWKRIAFTALILASKIWDDESFENDNFSKAFPQFTTKEINKLERIFLEFLDYNLMISGSEYAKYYFILRTFAEKNKKSFPLKALNVQTVRLLQKKAATTSRTLKEYYAEPLNKTFN